MSLAFYMDEHVPSPIAKALRKRGADVVTAPQDGREREPDPKVLDRATQLNHLLFTRDDDFFAEASRRQRNNMHFVGIIYAHQLHVPIGRCIEDLHLIAEAGDHDEFDNSVTHLPL